MKTLQTSYAGVHTTTSTAPSVIHRALEWCSGQEKNLLGWVAAIITGHGCFITPFTLLFVML